MSVKTRADSTALFLAAHEEEAQKNHKYPPQTRVFYHPQRPVWGTWEYPHLVSGIKYYLPAKQNYLIIIIMMMVELAKILFGSNYSPRPIFHITTIPQNCEVAACIGNPIAVLCSHCVLCSMFCVLCSRSTPFAAEPRPNAVPALRQDSRWQWLRNQPLIELYTTPLLPLQFYNTQTIGTLYMV